jgi:hypothetical protein
MVTIRLPEGLGKYCDGERRVSVSATTLGGALAELVSRYPSVGSRLFDSAGQLHVHLMVLCNERAVPGSELSSRELVEGDEIGLVFLAGGG